MVSIKNGILPSLPLGAMPSCMAANGPDGDSGVLRRLFDKWRLFLFRLVLIRLGYQGKIVSPHRGWSIQFERG